MQTTVQDELTASIPGMPHGVLERAKTYVNSRNLAAKVVDFEITVQNSTAYTFLVGGVPITYTSDGSATVAEIRDGLIAAHAAAALAYPNSGPAKTSAAASGDDVRITELSPAEGEVPVSDSDANLAISVVTPHAEEEAMVPGRVVVEADSGGSTALGTTPQARLPRGTGKIPVGVVMHSHRGTQVSAINADAVYDPDQPFPVYWGPIVVDTEDAVAQGGQVYFRHTASGANTSLGKCRSDGDSSTADALTGWRYKTGTSGAGLAIIEPR